MAANDDKIQEIWEKYEKLLVLYEQLKLQQARYESIVHSEAGTTERNRVLLNEKIDKVENEIKEILFDRKDGLAFVIDRLLEKDKKREQMRVEMKAMWITVAGLALKIIYDLLTK